MVYKVHVGEDLFQETVSGWCKYTTCPLISPVCVLFPFVL